ncbi:hypothetical protein [Methylovulum psychrotolerans]|uniref:Uncharacterized protein n=1 Tax=Methylovulum psychrotolerans TaxID=1704499 RepID=A0A1Z4C4C3_9GAMM|nr:hypothetical protein [Methylovulum psychrotolerans]ASF48406.1 hypothetical protein CEK71_21375 [Methylovulum psychrotolerans]
MSQSTFPIPIDPEIAAWAATLDENARELFEERAGIRQYEAGLSRREAESAARDDVLRWLKRQS